MPLFIFRSIVFITSVCLASCLSFRIPTPNYRYSGVFQSCQKDSTILTIDTLIRLKPEIKCRSCNENKYLKCDNLPDYIDFLHVYPGNIVFNFKTKEYIFIHSNKSANLDIKYGQENFAVAYNFDSGTIKRNKKYNTWTLKSTVFNWSRTFSFSYSKQNSMLTLKSVKDP